MLQAWVLCNKCIQNSIRSLQKLRICCFYEGNLRCQNTPVGFCPYRQVPEASACQSHRHPLRHLSAKRGFVFLAFVSYGIVRSVISEDRTPALPKFGLPIFPFYHLSLSLVLIHSGLFFPHWSVQLSKIYLFIYFHFCFVSYIFSSSIVSYSPHFYMHSLFALLSLMTPLFMH